MSGELERRRPGPPAVAGMFSGRHQAKADRETMAQARADYNRAMLDLHRSELNTIVEKEKAKQRADLVQDAMMYAREVDDFVDAVGGHKEGLQMTLREMQQGYNSAEVARIVKRGYRS